MYVFHLLILYIQMLFHFFLNLILIFLIGLMMGKMNDIFSYNFLFSLELFLILDHLLFYLLLNFLLLFLIYQLCNFYQINFVLKLILVFFHLVMILYITLLKKLLELLLDNYIIYHYNKILCFYHLIFPKGL